MTPIIITSINEPTKAVKLFSRLSGFELIVVGDSKTPLDYNYPNTQFLSLKKQSTLFPTFAKLLPINSYSRKNLGYLSVIKNSQSEWLFETDDDNFPLANFALPNLNRALYPTLATDSDYFNVFNLFSKKKAWLRGFPLDLINKKIPYELSDKKIKPLLIQSLINLDSDFDAVYRLTLNRPIRLARSRLVAYPKNLYGQVNSQATWWHKSLWSLLYFPSSVSWRAADIWRGYIAQKIMWQINANLLYVSPQVYQKRLRHNVMADFESELPLYIKTRGLVKTIVNLELKGSISDMLFQVYTSLVKNDFFDKAELKRLKEWQRQI